MGVTALHRRMRGRVHGRHVFARRPFSVAARVISLFVLTALIASGCGETQGAPAPVSDEQLAKGSLGRSYDLGGTQFTVGSKEFTESQILSKITTYAIRASGGKTVDQTGLQGSTIARSALTSKQIDMYWEYAGTGWSQFLQHDTAIPESQQQFRATAQEDLRKNGIAWLGPARFGNQYAIARSADAPPPLGEVNTMSEMAEFTRTHPDQATLCGASEFLDRELQPMQQTYDMRIPLTQISQNAFALNFVNAAKRSPCNFAEVFTTDARIRTLNLKQLTDDRHAFSTQLAGLTVRRETAQKHPELVKLTEEIGNKLTEDVMIELNGMVDIDGASPDQAALHFLRTNGFVG